MDSHIFQHFVFLILCVRSDVKSSNPSPSSVEKKDCSVTEQHPSASVYSASKAQPPPNVLPAASDSSLVPAVSLMSLEIRPPATLHIFKSVFQQHLHLSPLTTSHQNLIITPCSLPAVPHHQHHPHQSQ